MEHQDLVAWEQRLKGLFDEIDDALEEKYGRLFKLHPSRPKRGTTSNKEQDGLFNVGASFTPGFGSNIGRGYVVDLDVVTLESVPVDIRRLIEDDVFSMLNAKLSEHFPDRSIHIGRDGRLLKIFGDLSFRRR